MKKLMLKKTTIRTLGQPELRSVVGGLPTGPAHTDGCPPWTVLCEPSWTCPVTHECSPTDFCTF